MEHTTGHKYHYAYSTAVHTPVHKYHYMSSTHHCTHHCTHHTTYHCTHHCTYKPEVYSIRLLCRSPRTALSTQPRTLSHPSLVAARVWRTPLHPVGTACRPPDSSVWEAWIHPWRPLHEQYKENNIKQNLKLKQKTKLVNRAC